MKVRKSLYMLAVAIAVIGILFLGIAATIEEAFLLGMLEEKVCSYLPNEYEDHCYQDAAVRMQDPAACEQIMGADFSVLEGNPPRDKCYLRIAVATGDPSICANIVGGIISYTQAGCLESVAQEYLP
jgi:hypothetical protein